MATSDARVAVSRVYVGASSGRKWQKALLRFARRKPMGALGAVLILFMVFIALFADVIAPFDPFVIEPTERLLPPGIGAKHLLGTDNFGADVFSRVIHGSRVSLFVGMAAVTLSVCIGAGLGIVSGYWGGRIDMAIQRGMDILMAFPSLILALAIVAMMGASLLNVIIAIGITQSPAICRVIRSAVLTVKENAYIEAAHALGCRDRRIVALHVVPNIMAPIIVYVSINVGFAILSEASLSFLGLGTPPPQPTWGGMLSGASKTFLLQAPWLAIFPGIAISLTVLGFNMLGDALRDILDPRLRGR